MTTFFMGGAATPALSLDAQRGCHPDQSSYQAVYVLFGVGGGAGDAEQVLRGGRAEHRVDVDAFREQRLAETAQVDLVLDDHGDDGGFAGQDVEAAGAQLVAQQLRGAQQVQAALGFLLHDVESRADRRDRGRGQAGREHERPGRVLEVIDDGALGGDEASDLLKVPITMSMSSSTPRCSAAPAPVGPSTPMPCASST